MGTLCRPLLAQSASQARDRDPGVTGRVARRDGSYRPALPADPDLVRRRHGAGGAGMAAPALGAAREDPVHSHPDERSSRRIHRQRRVLARLPLVDARLHRARAGGHIHADVALLPQCALFGVPPAIRARHAADDLQCRGDVLHVNGRRHDDPGGRELHHAHHSRRALSCLSAHHVHSGAVLRSDRAGVRQAGQAARQTRRREPDARRHDRVRRDDTGVGWDRRDQDPACSGVLCVPVSRCGDQGCARWASEHNTR